jgi:hypothetical protein
MTLGRVEISSPDGTRVTFELPVEVCERLVERLVGPKAPKVRRARTSTNRPTKTRFASARVSEMKRAFDRVVPSNDSERIAVIATLAKKWNETPIDAPYVAEWFDALQLRRPAYMRSAMANSKIAGFLATEARGSFAPTALALALTRGTQMAPVVQLRSAR